jgi:hypothetical protein
MVQTYRQRLLKTSVEFEYIAYLERTYAEDSLYNTMEDIDWPLDNAGLVSTSSETTSRRHASAMPTRSTTLTKEVKKLPKWNALGIVMLMSEKIGHVAK